MAHVVVVNRLSGNQSYANYSEIQTVITKLWEHPITVVLSIVKRSLTQIIASTLKVIFLFGA